MWKKNRRMIKRLAVSLAAVATLAPTAQARVDEIGATKAKGEQAVVRPDDRAERFSLTHSIGQIAIRPDDRADRFTRTDAIGIGHVATRPDDRADRFTGTDGIGQVASRPDDRALRPMLEPATDWLGRPAAVILPEGPKFDGSKLADKVVVSGDGFDWSDAGIGAAGLFGAMLLAGAAVLLVRGNRKLASV
jgi:hypothetical protein